METNKEQLEANLAHWKQVKRDARKQLEYARKQFNICKQKLAQLALESNDE